MGDVCVCFVWGGDVKEWAGGGFIFILNVVFVGHFEFFDFNVGCFKTCLRLSLWVNFFKQLKHSLKTWELRFLRRLSNIWKVVLRKSWRYFLKIPNRLFEKHQNDSFIDLDFCRKLLFIWKEIHSTRLWRSLIPKTWHCSTRQRQNIVLLIRDTNFSLYFFYTEYFSVP